MDAVWIRQEEEQLIHQVQELGTRPSMAKIEGKTKPQIRARVAVLQKKGEITRRFVTRQRTVSNSFTTTEMKLIKEQTALAGERRKSALKISITLRSHTQQSIATVIKNNRWADPVRSECVSKGRKNAKQNRETVGAYLDGEGEGKYLPIDYVADKLGVSIEMVRSEREARGLVFNHAESMEKSAIYREMFDKIRLNRKKGLRSKMKTKFQKIRELLRELKQTMSKGRKPPEKKQCALCGEEWFKTKEFFRHKTFKRATKRQDGIYITARCRACPSKTKEEVAKQAARKKAPAA